MSVARLNGSHADLEWHRKMISRIRQTLPDVPILLDIPGRKIRTALLRLEPKFLTGDTVILTTDLNPADLGKISVNYSDLHLDLKAGDVVMADDGTLKFTVKSVVGHDIHLRADCEGQLKSRKGINVPFVKLRTPEVTNRDRELIAFARQTGVDYVGISFVESGNHVRAIRELIGGNSPRIVAKVENQGGIDNLIEVLEATDVVMIDRGDLSVETSIEMVALFQKQILAMAGQAGKPVIVATEMLHSMIVSRYPTKAEVSDITNAVLDGCAAAMLSGETAVGAYPVESVDTMRRIVDSAVAFTVSTPRSYANTDDPRYAMANAIAMMCRDQPVTKVVAVTSFGYAPRVLSLLFLKQPIIAVSNNEMTARSCNIFPGVEGVHVDIPFSRTSTDHVVDCLRELFIKGHLTSEDFVLVVAVGYPRSGRRMNLVQTHAIDELATLMGWAQTRVSRPHHQPDGAMAGAADH
jgi:pyruvate kinase